MGHGSRKDSNGRIKGLGNKWIPIVNLKQT